ncbi:SHOCT domain-containing protein [Wukongibacter baidiensis]|uniref:SHOCT domain-containing protein n=1 Tax=Wukongibacter baidiensis TaxID=1723361 RepID=UPI003D7FEBE2
MMHWMGFNRFGWMGGGFMMILWPLMMGLIFYFVFRHNRRHCMPMYNDNSRALEILDEKFASGEIAEEEYLHKKKLITK